MGFDFRKHRVTLVIIGLFIVTGLSIAPFLSASCSTHQRSAQGEEKAIETLRTMTRGGVLPAEDAVVRIENAYPNSRVAGLARMVRARIRLKAGDAAGAAALLDSSVIRERTALGDYALLMRGRALEQAGRRAEARADYERLARDYPSSIRMRDAVLHDAEMLMQAGEVSAVPTLLKELIQKNDAAALLLSAKAYEQMADSSTATFLPLYRRIYFYAPTSTESAEAATAIAKYGSTTSPAAIEEAIARADKLYQAKRYAEAADAYTDAFARFPSAATPEAQLRRGIAASNAKRTTDAIAALNSVPSSAGDVRAEALYNLALTYAKARQWAMARSSAEELRRLFPQSAFAPRAFVAAGQIARDAKTQAEALNFFRAAVAAFPGSAEVAQAQFEVAWAAHESKNYQESSRLLTEHLALYADKNTDNRGRAGYWAARDSERAGKLAEARALYEAMQVRYDANWYGHLSKQRLENMKRNGGNAQQKEFAGDSPVGRAIANLQTVTVAEETAGAQENERAAKADQLWTIGAEDWALEELDVASAKAPSSPRINLAIARIYRSRTDNLRAFNTLRRSYPDYSQMKPEELTREEWDVFYPLAYWDIISHEAKAKGLDPHQVAGLIRQESVFNPLARSPANAYGLMQLLVPTGRLVAKRYGVEREITADALYEPRLNIQLGTAYMREQMNKFGRIEYVAVAYNAGPGKVPEWRAQLPLEMDEFAEAIPYKETRGYVQGVVRNQLQYERLYDDNGQFRASIGTRAVNPALGASQTGAPAITTTAQPADSSVRRRRVTGNEEE